MASNGKKTTMAKLTRENRVRERRREKQAKKDARRRAAAQPTEQPHDAERVSPHPPQPAAPLASSGASDTTSPGI
jgi:hypothetical protein